jgi:hypothetical protein
MSIFKFPHSINLTFLKRFHFFSIITFPNLLHPVFYLQVSCQHRKVYVISYKIQVFRKNGKWKAVSLTMQLLKDYINRIELGKSDIINKMKHSEKTEAFSGFSETQGALSNVIFFYLIIQVRLSDA